MYIIRRRFYYKTCLCLGIVICIMSSILLYFSIVLDTALVFSFIFFFYSIAYTLFYLIKYLRKDLDFVALRIDESGMFLCSKKDEGIFISWEKIRYVIFVVADSGSKIIIRQHNKDTYELLLTHYFHSFRPKSAIKAAYEYADNKKKIREVKDWLPSSYEQIMWNISKTEVKHATGDNTTEENDKSKKKKTKGKNHRNKHDKPQKGDSTWKSLLLWAILLLAVVNIAMWVEDTCLHTLLPICIPWMYYLFILVIVYVVLELTFSYFSISRKNVAKRHTFPFTFSFKCIFVLVLVPAFIFLPNRYIQIESRSEHQGVIVDNTTWKMTRATSSDYVKIRIDEDNASFWYNMRKDSKPLGSKCRVSLGRGLFGMRYVEEVSFDSGMP